MDTRTTSPAVGSIAEINALPRDVAESVYLRLVPPELLDRLRIDPTTLRSPAGRLVKVTVPAAEPWARVEVRASPDDRDPMLMVDIEMSALSLPELAFVQITDPAGPRFDIDRDADGTDTLFGTVARNLEEEARAMRHGLAPGQVRRGLRLLGPVLASMDAFCRFLGFEIYLIEPLFYHSAILYERRGCGYLLGRELMEETHAAFAEAGALTRQLDGSTPFRAPDAGRTARTRSWALHDGLTGQRWGGLKMYKAVGRDAGVRTFPDGIY